ncbi:MAG: hypothetical protein CVU11_13310 [Bacteroidetes bacterium HGW-Bacteroidetes-6]|jgi:hypothetical protein|nr:MAG: hypothetical protein CVU11_13310 [Bacteroidetes bacterium HGW-Bacteroidetes-6]
MKKTFLFLLTGILFLTIASCQVSKDNSTQNEKVKGFGFFNHIPGIWHGPVISTTSAGSFPEWYADFRPVSASQISQYSNLDSQTVNNMSFFIVQYEGELKIAMRTEGCFNQSCCVTYEVMDSVNENEGYYRFSDFRGGANRAATSFVFRGDSMIMEVYTSKFNKEKTPVLHSRWLAVHGDKNSANNAIGKYKYPLPLMVRDFSHVFDSLTESIYFVFESDPYPTSEQPCKGKASIKIDIDKSLKMNKNAEVFVLLTTQSIYDGLKLKPDYHNYYSRYIYLSAETNRITICNVHPGTYHLYAFVDTNGDKLHQSGEYMSSAVENVITVNDKTTIEAKVVIDMVIP